MLAKMKWGGRGFNESFKLIKAKEIFYVDNLINLFFKLITIFMYNLCFFIMNFYYSLFSPSLNCGPTSSRTKPTESRREGQLLY